MAARPRILDEYGKVISGKTSVITVLIVFSAAFLVTDFLTRTLPVLFSLIFDNQLLQFLRIDIQIRVSQILQGDVRVNAEVQFVREMIFTFVFRRHLHVVAIERS